MSLTRIAAAACILVATSVSALAADRPMVIELYTSQGCSSCPPADAYLKKLATDPKILALSVHVHYWDYLGWKDPYASVENTNRQRAYKSQLGGQLYTPQMIIEGAFGAVGSKFEGVSKVIELAKKDMINVPIKLTPDKKNNQLNIDIAATAVGKGAVTPDKATVWALKFKRHGNTEINGGENDGRTLESVNNVVKMAILGTWKKSALHLSMPLEAPEGYGVAILLQTGTQGRIIGAASHLQ